MVAFPSAFPMLFLNQTLRPERAGTSRILRRGRIFWFLCGTVNRQIESVTQAPIRSYQNKPELRLRHKPACPGPACSSLRRRDRTWPTASVTVPAVEFPCSTSSAQSHAQASGSYRRRRSGLFAKNESGRRRFMQSSRHQSVNPMCADQPAASGRNAAVAVGERPRRTADCDENRCSIKSLTRSETPTMTAFSVKCQGRLRPAKPGPPKPGPPKPGPPKPGPAGRGLAPTACRRSGPCTYSRRHSIGLAARAIRSREQRGTRGSLGC
jgi:hypothetical protein